MFAQSTSADQPLSATSAALLGQLAWADQSPYELAKAMGGNVKFFWPRADSHVYREVKRLVADGYATARDEGTGRRPRTVYAISARGRKALADWLATPSAGFAQENEPLLRVFVATNGRKEDLLAAVRAAREQAEAMLDIGDGLAAQYEAGTHPFMDEVHIRALTFDYLYNWAILTRDWADRTEAEVSRWRDLRQTPRKQRRAADRIRGIAKIRS
jgi:PadR family transcriptional regulator, regulatory protein AphA